MTDLPTLLFTLGAIPLFASRTFATAFCFAGLARFLRADSLLWLDGGDFRLDLGLRFPEWLISDQALALLLLLAVLESMADKNPDVRLFMAEFQPWTRGLMDYVFNNVAFAVSLGAVAALEIRQAGLGELGWTLIPAAGVVGVAALRRGVLGFLSELDEDDALGLRKLISWAEDGWVVLGSLLVVVFPVLALAIAGLTVAGLWLTQKLIERREQRMMVPCASCDQPILPSATSCFACRAAVASPVAVGLFGQPTQRPALDLDTHRLDLLSKKRCLVCASRLRQKRLQQRCDTCGNDMLPSAAWADHYLAYVDRRLRHTLLVCTGLSLVPIVGLIPGILYYRLGLISALRIYLPPATGCLTRSMVRAVNLLLLALQWVPLLGGLTLPAMCYFNYRIYRSALVDQRRLTFAKGTHAAAG